MTLLSCSLTGLLKTAKQSELLTEVEINSCIWKYQCGMFVDLVPKLKTGNNQ